MTAARMGEIVSIYYAIHPSSLFGFDGGMDVDASAVALRSLLRAALATQYPQAEIVIDIRHAAREPEPAWVHVRDTEGKSVEDDGSCDAVNRIIEAICADRSAWQQRWATPSLTDVKQMGDYWRAYPLEGEE